MISCRHIQVFPSNIEGTVTAPSSKSYTHRAIFSSLMAKGKSIIVNPLISNDTKATITAVKKMGAKVSINKQDAANDILLVYSEKVRHYPWFYCRGSGTTIRILLSITAMFSKPTLLYGNKSLNRRPMGPLIRALETLGARIKSFNSMPPITLIGFKKPSTKEVVVDGSLSSQFITSLLFIAPIYGLKINIESDIVSKPYIDITLRVLEMFGVKIVNNNYKSFIAEEQDFKASTIRIPGDFSSASFLLAAGSIGGKIKVKNLYSNDVQGDKKILEILRLFGAKTRIYDNEVIVEGDGFFEPIDLDFKDTPDLVPISSVLAAYARGKSFLRNISHLKHKESNRIASIISNLKRIGVEARYKDKTLIINGKGKVIGGVIDDYGDHRIAMSFAIAGIGSEKGVFVKNILSARDSYPTFLSDLKNVGLKFVCR